MNNTIDLDITINNKKEFYSKYNEGTLNRQLQDYILNELVGYNEKYKLNIHIKTKLDLTDEEKEKYAELIRNEFRENYIDLKDDVIKHYRKSIILTAMGLVLLVIGLVFSKYEDSLLSEIFNIGGWLLIWESGYEIIYTLVDRKKEMKRFNQIITSNIEFMEK